MSLQQVRSNPVTVHHYPSRTSGKRPVEPQATFYRTQSVSSRSSERAISKSHSQRQDNRLPMSGTPPSSWYQYGNPPRSEMSPSASTSMHTAQAPGVRRDSWPPESHTSSQAVARPSRSVRFADDYGRPESISAEPSARSPTVTYPRPQRKPSNRDEFDGPHQFLNPPSPRTLASKEQAYPNFPTSLSLDEQRDILARLTEILSKCAFDFIAMYQFPIPVEPDKPLVISSRDREWTEWVYLLKRLATKRRIPARVLYENQIKRLVTVLENSLEPPEGPATEPRLLKDDRAMLQYISAGIQVARILQDGSATCHLDRLYVQTEKWIQDRRYTGLPI